MRAAGAESDLGSFYPLADTHRAALGPRCRTPVRTLARTLAAPMCFADRSQARDKRGKIAVRMRLTVIIRLQT
jgi:hypothetical protein